MSVKNKIKKIISSIMVSKEQNREEKLIIANTDIKRVPLTSAEKKEVVELWKPVLKVKSFKELEIMKSCYGFDPRMVSHYMYLPLISRRLNNYKYTKFFENKSLLGTLSDKIIDFPYNLARFIDGKYFSDDMKLITLDDVITRCLAENEFIIKDSTETSNGKSVEKIYKNNMTEQDYKIKICESLNKRGKKDFVIQKVVKQSSILNKFNQTSVNTFRIHSLFINDKCSVCMISLRVGKTGSIVDNFCSGGFAVGLHKDGTLFDFAYDGKYNKYDNINGFDFKNEKIEIIPELIKLVEKAHVTMFPLCGFIGWDITLDVNNKPVVIEINSSQPGVIEFEPCGPIFGERTEEVINYCKEKKFIYNKGFINY